VEYNGLQQDFAMCPPNYYLKGLSLLSGPLRSWSSKEVIKNIFSLYCQRYGRPYEVREVDVPIYRRELFNYPYQGADVQGGRSLGGFDGLADLARYKWQALNCPNGFYVDGMEAYVSKGDITGARLRCRKLVRIR
jgi:hypothetical protein